MNEPSRLLFDAVIFDMDGVVTRTADLHAAAWKSLFDSFLLKREGLDERARRPFDVRADYLAYVDGKPRYAGVRGFLASRHIELPEGRPEDPPEAETVFGLGKRKDVLFEGELQRQGVKVFETTIALINDLRQARCKTGLVTSSRHGREVVAQGGLKSLFDVCLDGQDIHALDLAGKPDPAAFLECAHRLGVRRTRAIVVEDAAAGVRAGKAGGFAFTLGVDRGGNREALMQAGADAVVSDLSELALEDLCAWVDRRQQEQAWLVEQTGFDPAREPGLESIFALGNGHLGVRGVPDIPLPNSQGDLFIAGIYASKAVGRPYSEHEFLTEERNSPYAELASFPFPFRIAVAANGTQLGLSESRWRSRKRVLDMRQASLHSETSYTDPAGAAITLRSRRMVSLADRHLLLQELTLRAENRAVNFELNTSMLEPDLAGMHPHLLAAPVKRVNGMEVHCFRTQGSDFQICLAKRCLLCDREPAQVEWRLRAERGEALLLRVFVAVYTSRDRRDPEAAAIEHLCNLSWDSFDEAMGAHHRSWSTLWERADIVLSGSPSISQALRFHVYHLSSAADQDPRVSVGARALAGRAYEGHVFWDVEVFMLPFYLYTQPAVARSLLRYRHYTLNGARQRARELGYQGACYAWESTADGLDVTPRKIVLRTTQKEIPIFTGTQQIHVTAGIAHGIRHYWEATGDDHFMVATGTEILAETVRFWCSRCVRENGTYHLRDVVGPDEYHHSVSDNAYTNWMAYFNVLHALEASAWMKREQPGHWAALCERINLDRGELELWRDLARNLYRPMPNEQGVIEQFDGFFALDEYSLLAEERFKAPISRLFDWEEINRLKLIKQADVLMLLFLFPELFPREIVAANYAYYEPLTDHGSSLSPPVHATIAARLGRREEAEAYWRQGLFLDLTDVMHNSSLGVHPAAMGGSWQALVTGFLGVTFSDAGPMVAPEALDRLPEPWRSLALKLQWRGHSFPVELRR